MRDENSRMWEQLCSERRKVDKLVQVVGRLWDVVGKGFPGSLPQFPSDLLDTAESPNIYITSPTATSSSRFPPPLSMNMHPPMHNLNSPNSSPTAADFPSQHHSQHGHHHGHTPHSLSRQHSFQHVSSYRGGESTSSSTPLPSSPGGSISTMDLFDDGSCDPPPSGRGSTKRQRIDESGVGVGVNGSDGSMSLMSSVSSPGSGTGGGGGGGGGQGISGLTVPKKSSSRARSDSAPLGYAGALWQQGGLGGGGGVNGRPRSGSGMMSRGIPNIGNMTRGNNASTPLLSITTADSDLSGR
ncbi:hypothetical protein M413DRAFT_194513 [Hebeloma cylindrosporum]|uniref:Uncharacterized protein n=1 Tax=Hebeloma cylindrosporum TaxID=76867 RepID=A0A0C3C7W6_HEBCY|nr:hypothetical protein M413DRAFT_194513 [Hebeloma cylindrosporum h7]